MEEQFLMIGKTLGHYEITSQLGKGGMGEVYQAKDLKLGRDVAIKVLPDEFAKETDRVARFEREAKLLASLNHPNIAAIYGLEESGETNFLVLELVEGETLADQIKKHPIPGEESLKLALQIAAALETAHKKGIIHRDLKPSNIMVTDEGSVKLLDFGLAKLYGQDASLSTSPTADFPATQAGAVLGTVAYMSPEQAQGRPADARSDIFSFGAVLYEMLSGRRAFVGDSSFAVMTAIVKEDPPALQISQSLDKIVRRCLAKQSSGRYQTMSEVKAALEQFTAERATVKATEPQPSIAVLPFVNMSGDKEQEYFSDGLAEEIINALTQIPGLKVIARTSAFAFKGKQEDITKIAEALRVSTILEGSVRKAGNRIRVTAQLITAADGSHLWSERYDRQMTDVFAIQDEIAQAITDKLRVHLSGDYPLVKQPTEKMEAYNLNLKGRHHLYRMTPEGLAKGKEYFERAIEMDSHYASPWHGLAAVYHLSSTYFGAAPSRIAYEQSRQAVLKALELDRLLPEAHAHLAMLLASEFDWKGAESEFLRALELGPGSWEVWDLYSLYFLIPMRRMEEALAAMRQAGELNPLSPLIQTAIALLYGAMRQYDQAIAHCANAIELDPQSFSANALLGGTYVHKGEFDEGIRIIEAAASSLGRHAAHQGILGWAYAAAGRTREAHQLLEELLVAARNAYVPASYVAMVYSGLGEIEECLDWLHKGAEEREFGIFQVFYYPSFDQIRSHPRFLALLLIMNLEA